MTIQNHDAQTAVVTGLVELVAANAAQVRDEIRAALPATAVRLDLDLSALTFLDSSRPRHAGGAAQDAARAQRHAAAAQAGGERAVGFGTDPAAPRL